MLMSSLSFSLRTATTLPKARIAALTLAIALLVSGSASAATFVVNNTADSGTGSLRQAILDANNTPGADLIKFTIPEPGPFRITVLTPLPAFTDTVYLDATTQPGYHERPPIGSPDPVGVAGLLRPPLPWPIVQVFGNSLPSDGLVFGGSNNNSTIRGLQVWGFRGTNVVFTDSNSALVDVNVIGLNEALADPGSGLRAAINLSIDGNNPNVKGNLIASVGTPDNVLISSRGQLHVSGNELVGTLRLSAGPLLATPFVKLVDRFITFNLIRDSFGYGLDIVGGLENMEISNNTVRNNGAGGVNPAGIRLTNEGANSSRNNVLDLNIVTGNQGPGILVTGNSISSNRGNTITRNSIFGNGGIGIDLGGQMSNPLIGDGPTPNDPGDVDPGGNELLNFPVIESATISGNSLTVTGWSGHNTTIEFFAAPAGSQGRTFLASRDEASSSDLDSTTSSYGPGPINGVAQGSDTTDRFRFVITLLPGFAGFPAGSVLTATATEPGGISSTSEFSGPAPVTPTADLAITKGAPSRRSLGANLQYTIIVTNNGPSEAPNATIVDPTPVGLTFVANTGACTTAFPCVLDAIPAGQSRVITTTFFVPSGYTGPDPIVNTATVSSTATDPDMTNNSATATTAVGPLFTINVEIKKNKVGPASVTPGTDLVYLLTVTNNGTLDATDVTVDDPTPVGLMFVSNAGDCTTPFLCALGTIPAGESRQIITTFAVPSGYSTPNPISNTSTVTTTVADQDPTDNVATTTTGVIPPSADLSITKIGEASARPGNTILYVLSVANAGPADAQAVVVSDPTPAGLTFVSNSGACTTAFPCSLGTLRSGEMRTITATFTVGAGATAGPIINSATVSASTIDASTANNTSTFTSAISDITVGNADVQLTKTASTGTVAPDGAITYVLAATNLGPEKAGDVTIQDATPAGTVFVSVSPSPGGSCTTPAAGTAGTVICVWSDATAMGPAGERSFRLVVRVAADAVNGTSVLNTGGVTTTSFDPALENNSASALTNVYVGGPSADIEVQKILVVGAEPGGGLLVPMGQGFTFWMKVFNHGPQDATGIVVRDFVPSSLIPLSYVASQGSFNPSTGVWTVGDLPQGGMALLDLTAMATQPGPMQNMLARVASQPVDPNALNDLSSAGFSVAEATGGERFVAVGEVDGNGQREIVVGVGAAERPEVRVFTSTGAETSLNFLAYRQDFRGGVRVASCDVTGDGIAEIITGAGPGGGPHVRILSAGDAGLVELGGFFAYAPTFGGGVFVACGDVTGDGVAEIITGAGAGGGPQVRVFQVIGGSVTELVSFFAYDPAFPGGVLVAAGDVTGDGIAEIVTGAGPSGSPHVRVWSLIDGVSEVAGFFAYDPGFAGGVSVATGDIDGDGVAEIVTGPGPGGGPHVRVFNVSGAVTERASFMAYDPAFPGGVLVASGDLNGDGRAEIITGPRPGGGPHVRIFTGFGVPIGGGFFVLGTGTANTTLLADVQVSITHPAVVTSGELVTFAIQVTNPGPGSATSVDVTFPPVAGLRFTSNAGACTGSFPCALGTLGAGETRTIFSTFAVEERTGTGRVANIIEVSAADPDPVPLNNVAVANMIVVPRSSGERFVAVGDVNGNGAREIVVGVGAADRPEVEVFTSTGAESGLNFLAYHEDFRGGVRVASCDVTGDGVAEIITGAGPGGGPHVRILNAGGAGFVELAGFFAYAPTFGGGVFVACGDVTGDGVAEIITGAGVGGGPQVRVFQVIGGSVTELAGFFAYDPAFPGGVHVAAGDVTGDGVAEIVTGAGPSGGPHVRVWSLRGGLSEIAGFFAYDPGFTGGVSVATGDIDGDGVAEIVTGPGPGGGPHVRVFNVSGAVTERASFMAYDPAFPGGVLVASGDLNGDGRAEIITGPGPGGGPHVRVFTGSGVPSGVEIMDFAFR
jgi:uncharacterized repeat protein (TIGR01451 family)